jgi:Kef-type K+ transport system membrane component KefB
MLVDLNLVVSLFVGLVLTLTSVAIMIAKLKNIC